MINIFNQGWVGTLIGLIGILLAFYFHKVSKKVNELTYTFKTERVVGKNNKTPEDIEIVFRGKPVERVTNTQITVWNSGNVTIEGKNIVEKDPLRILISEGQEIISATILEKSRDANDFIIKTDENNPHILEVEFDYLDAQDGAVIEILHTDNENSFELKGSIKGLKSFNLFTRNNKTSRLIPFTLLNTMVVAVLLNIIILYQKEPVDNDYSFLTVVFSSISLILSIITYFLSRKNKRKMPKNLQI
ncbi:hypothetical protein [Bacillus vallismortis]|uniref:hypothetical protein n=1 Tax=Bacillus vallismortis TaxID=72361 RepID=UPI000EF4703E|nr:hypothetical protein [Bacillus vallismortis]